MTSWLSRFLAKYPRAIVGASACLLSFSALANPVLDNVAAGQANIQQNGNSTVVNQSSQKAILNWQSFNIGQGESTHFNQPAGGIALNRINPSQGVSQIFGQLTATGQIILINPAGIYFGPSAFVNVGGLVATTHNITDANFLSGHFSFNKVDAYSGAIVNEGTIIAAQHGLVALVAPGVVNNGMIQANLGKVVLASGNAFTMSFDGSGLVNFAINEATTSRGRDRNGNELADGVTNTGSIIANGGAIMVSGKAAAGVLDRVINMEGLAQAQSVQSANGEIILYADTQEDADNVIRLAGALDASGRTSGLVGGNITITGKYILVDEGTHIDASGDAGGGNVFIGGNYLGQGPLPTATAVVMAPTAKINADAINSGNGGQIILWSDDYTNVAGGTITARGGAQGGNGGFIETSSKNILNVGDVLVDTSSALGQAGTWLLDPYNITIDNVSTTNGSFDGSSPNTFTANADNATVLNTTIQNNLANANVIITTAGAGLQAGNITVSAPITWASTNSLSFIADGTIAINGAITTGAAGSALILSSGGAITQSAAIGGSGGLTLNSNSTLTLSQTNTYTGTTTINNSGTISIAADAALGTAPGAPTAGHLILNNGTLLMTAPITLNANRGILLGAGGGTISVTDNATIAGEISGAGDLNAISTTLTALTLSGNNTYTGETIVNADTTLVAAHANALGSTAGGTTVLNGGTLLIDGVHIGNETLTLNGSGVNFGGALRVTGDAALDGNISSSASVSLAVTSASTLNLYGAISANSGLSLTSSGTLVLHNTSNSFSGVTMMGNGTLEWGASNVIPDTATFFFTAGAGNLLNLNGFSDTIGSLTGGNSSVENIQLGSGTLTINQTSNTTFDGGIGGSGNIIKAGSGTLTLSSVNHSYTGTTTINAGTLRLTAANALQNSSAVILANTTGAILNLNNNNNILNNLSGGGASGGNITLGSAVLTINQTSDSAYDGVISGTGRIIKDGAANLTLSRSNTFNGGVTLENGTLTVGNNSALGSGALTYNSGTLAASTNVTLANNITLNADLTYDSSNNLILSGVITDGVGTFGLIKAGSSTLTLSGTNTYDGSTTVNGGTLSIAADAALGNAPGVATPSSLILNGGTLQTTAGFTLNSNRGITLGASGGTFDTVTGTLTYTGVIDGVGDLTKINSGTLDLSNNLNLSTYTGATHINGGILAISRDYNLGEAPLTPTPDHLTLDGGTLAIDASISLSENRGITLGSGGGTFMTTNYAGVNYEGIVAGVGRLTQSGDGSLTLRGANTYSGGTTIYGNGSGQGGMGFASDASFGAVPLSPTANNVIIDGGYIYFDQPLTISSNRGIHIGTNGAQISNVSGGTVTYDGILTGSGDLSVSGSSGMISLGGNSTFSGYITLGSGTLRLASANALGTNAGDVSTTGGTIDFAFNNGTFARTGYIYLQGSDLAFSGTNIILDNNLALYNNDTQINVTGTATLNGYFNDSGQGRSITKTGNGTLIYAGNNSYGGATNINAGTLQLSGAGRIASNSEVVVDASATFDLNGVSNTIATLAGSGSVLLGGGTLTTGDATNTTFSGVISEAGSVVKEGSGTFTLSGANTYTGTTTINAGTLQLSGSGRLSDSTAVTVGASGTFDLNDVSDTIGSLAGSGTVLLGSGTLTTGDATNTVFSGRIRETGSVVKQGAGSFTLSGDNDFSGGLTFNAGDLIVGHNSALGSGTFTVNSSGQLQASTGGINIGNAISLLTDFNVGGNNNLTLSGGIADGAGTNDLNKSGSSTLTISGTNTYGGATNINAGTLTFGSFNALPTNTDVTIASGATLNSGTFGGNIGNLAGAGNIVMAGSSAGLTINQTTNTTFSGNISGTGDNLFLEGNGAGTAILTMSGTISGNFTNGIGIGIRDATLLINDNNVIGGSNQIYMDTSGVLQFADNVSDSVAGLQTVDNGSQVILGNNTVLTINADLGFDQDFSGVISGNGSLVKTGGDRQRLRGNNTFTNGVTVTEGILSVGNDNALGTGLLTLNGGTLEAFGARTIDNLFVVDAPSYIGDFHSFEFTNTGTLNSTLTVANDNDTTFSNVIDGTGSIIKTASGDLSLNAANTFSGGVTLSDGTLTVGDDAALGTGLFTYNAGTFATNGSRSLANAILLNATLDFNFLNDLELTGNIGDSTGSFGISKSGFNTLTLSGNNTFDGASALNSGTLILGSNTALGTSEITVGGGTIDASANVTLANNMVLTSNVEFNNSSFNITWNGTVIDNGGGYGIIKNDVGNLTLGGNNDYLGDTTINGGTLIAAHNNAFGNTSGDSSSGFVWATSGATLELANGINLNKYIFIDERGVGDAGALITNGTASISGTGAVVDLYNNPIIAVNGSGQLTIDAPIISTSGVLGFEKDGSGTLVLNGSNTFVGDLVLNQGTLTVGNNNALGGGALIYNAGVLTANTSVTLANNIALNAILEIDGTNDIGLNGVIDDAGASYGLIKDGTGNLTLAGNNTFDDSVTLNAGTLTVGNNNALGTNTLIYNAGTFTANTNVTLNNNIDINNNFAVNSTNNITLNGVINDGLGTFGITKSGSSNLTLSGSNTFDGNIAINGGTLTADNNNALGSTTGSTTVNSSATLTINGVSNAENITLNGGTLTSTGTSALTGNMTLASATATLTSNSGTLTLGDATHHINGNSALTLAGAGSFVLGGNIGNNTALTSLTANSAVALDGSSNSINAGSVAFNNTLNGASNLSITSSGTTTFGGAVGGSTALNSLTVTANGININGGAVTTVNDQVYNASVSLGADTTFTHTGTGTRIFNFTNGISGNRNINLNGSNTANTSFILTGTLAANNVTVNGGAAGNNTFTVNSNTNQDWNINAANGGTLNGVSGVTGTFAFNNIRSLVGGNLNDSFVLNGGSLSGNINGGAGSNTITAANIANTWNLAGTNTATSMTGVTGGFSNIQNLVGGTGDDHFIFADNALISGTISGGATLTNNGNNILDFSAYSTAVNAYMTNSSNEFIGNVRNSGNTMIANYSNIDRLVGNEFVDNVITLPTGKSLSTVTFTPATNDRVGYIGDPLYFDYWRVVGETPTPPTPPPTPTQPVPDVAQIVQQPVTNGTNNVNSPTNPASPWVTTETTVTQNITNITDQATDLFDTDLEKIQVNPFCTTTSN